MAKLYAFSEADRRKFEKLWSWFNAGGGAKVGHPIPHRRRPQTGGAIAGAVDYAMIAEDIPAAVLDGSAYTATPGKGGAETAHIMRWKHDVPVGGKTIIPLENLEEKLEPDPSVQVPTPPLVPVKRTPINFSMTEIRASVAAPILLAGHLQKFQNAPDEEEVFIVVNVMDFRALPNFAVGTDPETDMQIPYHAGDENRFQLDGEAC